MTETERQALLTGLTTEEMVAWLEDHDTMTAEQLAAINKGIVDTGAGQRRQIENVRVS